MRDRDVRGGGGARVSRLTGRLLLLFGCLAFGLALTGFGQAASATGPTGRQEAWQAARRDFPKFLTAALKRGSDYGFLPTDVAESVALAEPIPVYSLTPPTGAGLSPDGRDLYGAVAPAGEWIFPVAVSNAYRTLFGVRLRGSGWKGSYLGNPVLAANLQGIRCAWSTNGVDRFDLLSCVNPRGFFFSVPGHTPPNLTPALPVIQPPALSLSPPSDWAAVTPAHTLLASLNAYWAQQAQEEAEAADPLGQNTKDKRPSQQPKGENR